eukprot:gene2349-8654_t
MFADMKAYLDDPKVMFVLLAVVPVWLLGAASGHMMSRSRWLHALGSSAILHPWNLQIVALLINGVLIIRECFDRYMEAGAFSALAKAVLLWFCGKGWTFEFPQGKISDAKGKETKAAARSMEDDSWYVNSTDLQFYKDKIEIDQADDDPTPYGFTEGECASSLTKSKPMSMSSLSLVDRKPLGVIMEDPASDDETNNRLASPEPGNKKAFKRFATLAVASSIAVVMKHSYSTGSLSTMEPGMMKEETPEKSPDSISSSRDSATRRVAPRYRSTSRRLPRIRSAPYPMW